MSDEAAPAEEKATRERTVKVGFLRNYGPPEDWELPDGAKDVLGRILKGTTLRLPEKTVNELVRAKVVTRDWESLVDLINPEPPAEAE